MAPSALTLIRAAFLDRTEVSLGCLVPNPLEPGQDFCPVKPPIITAEEINTRSIHDLRESFDTAKDTRLRTKLARLWTGRGKIETRSSDELMARSATLYYLTHPTLHLETLYEDADTRAWIEKVMKRFPIFLVTGFLTVTEAEIARIRQQSTGVQVAAEVSASNVASAGAVTVILDVPDSVGVGLKVNNDANLRYSFVAPGERIIGVQYRKLKFKRFSAVDLEKVVLKRNSWVMFLGDRIHKGITATTGDVLEANVEESLTVDDLELEEYDLGLEDLEVEDEEFVFVE